MQIELDQADHKRLKLCLLHTTGAVALTIASAMSMQAFAQDVSDPSAAEPATEAGGGEIVVTASRRSETVSKLPFNISAYGGEQLGRSNITNVAALAQQVPNFALEDRGARSIASAIPIIRGLNASQPTVTSARYFQSPVGFYLGNAPVTGAFPLQDLERIEVLRGPQGTLYGAGALAGAVRIVPTDPQLGELSGSLSASALHVEHSERLGYTAAGTINIPLGETLALRVNGRYEYSPGFIDQKDILRRTDDNYVTGVPVLEDPADVAGSRAVYFDKDDVNFAKTTSARAALLWEPSADVSVTASYNFSRITGNGGPIDNPLYQGGPSPIDPRITLRGTDEYERSLPTLEPFDRTSHLAALDTSVDLGFATLSSTVAFGHTKGSSVVDSTVALLGSPAGIFYTSFPANPRIVIPIDNRDSDRSFTQEVRLVSEAGGPIDYIVGAFFQQQRRIIQQDIFAPGADAYSAAANGGSTLPIALGGTFVPLLDSSGLAYTQDVVQQFRDYSLYGELTWHITDDWQITGGGRLFHQTFNQRLTGASSLFLFTLDERASAKTTSQIFKVNTSYQFSDSSQVYATWSQGFRRGGGNAFALQGFVREPAELLTYVPDKTNNFEVGIKGRIGGISYSVDAFYVLWDKPQIDLLTPFILTALVANGSEAESKGVELEVSGPIGDSGFSFNLGAAYAKARLSESFSLPAGDGAGNIIEGAIQGLKGDRLPGAPDFSGSVTLIYKHEYDSGVKMDYALGVDFRTSTVNQLPSINPNSATRKAKGFATLRGSVGLDVENWRVELFGTNLTDKRAIISPAIRSATSVALLGDWGDSFVINRPREIGLRVTKSF